MIEKYAGAMPLWIAPEQARIMTIMDRADDAAYALKDKLEKAGIRVEVDSRNEKIGFKLREARTEKIPYLLVLGDKEAEAGTVAVTKRGSQESVVMSADELLAQMDREIADKVRDF
jgi:threonyl-tRNA synthetase